MNSILVLLNVIKLLCLLKVCSQEFSSLNVNVNSEPTPSLDLSVIWPPKISTICFEITRPRPIPLEFIWLLVSSMPNILNSLLWSSSDIPTPVSMTLICRYYSPPSRSSLMISTLRITLPSLVNLRALLWRFMRTYIILCSSQLIIEDLSSGMFINSAFSSIP